MTHNTLCAVCGGTLGRVLLVVTEPDRFERRCGVDSEGYRREWVECGMCGTVSNRLPRLSIERLNALRSSYYEVDFANSDIGDKYRKVMSLSPDQSDNWGRVERIRKFAAQWLPGKAPKKLLDIGAGTGVFLSRFLDVADGQWEAAGMEPDPTAAAHLRKVNRFPVIEAMFHGQAELRGFSLVTLNKVLEHIDEPIRVLRQVAQVLIPSCGLLYLEVPDKLTIGCRPPNDNILGALHCHLYHPGGVERLFREAGFEPLRIERVVEPSGKITVFGFACLPESLANI